MSSLDILFAPATTRAIQEHAQDCFPQEACGVVTADGFIPLKNKHPDPENFFDCGDAAASYQTAGTLLAVVHSHCAMPGQGQTAGFPSKIDMIQQAAMAVPWGICAVSAVSARQPWFWGPGIEIPPLIGRLFRHGPSGSDGRGDCYALIKDYYHLALGIDLPEGPRDWEWWLRGEDLYMDNFERAGLRRVRGDDVQIGDIGFCSSPVISRDGTALPPRAIHGVIYVGEGKVLHHKPAHPSVIEPLASWSSSISTWVRHASKL